MVERLVGRLALLVFLLLMATIATPFLVANDTFFVVIEPSRVDKIKAIYRERLDGCGLGVIRMNAVGLDPAKLYDDGASVVLPGQLVPSGLKHCV